MNATFGRFGQMGTLPTDATTSQSTAYETVDPGVDATPATNVQPQIIETPVTDVQPQIVETLPGEVPHWSEFTDVPAVAPAPAAPSTLTPAEEGVRMHIVPLIQNQGPDLLTLVAGGLAIAAIGLGVGAAMRR